MQKAPAVVGNVEQHNLREVCNARTGPTNQQPPPPATSSSHEAMLELIRENELLKQEVALLRSAGQEQTPPAVVAESWTRLYRVICPDSTAIPTYRDRPVLCAREDLDYTSYDHGHWRGQIRIAGPSRWKKKNENVPFVSIHEIHCLDQHRGHAGDDDDDEEELVKPLSSLHEIHVMSSLLAETLEAAFEESVGLKAYLDAGAMSKNILKAPYLFYHHFKAELEHFGEELRGVLYEDYMSLLQCIAIHQEENSHQAEALFARGKVNTWSLPYLFKPHALLVSQEAGVPTASLQVSTINEVSSDGRSRDRKRSLHYLTAESIEFNGDFTIKRQTFEFKLPRDDEVVHDIMSLEAWPLEYGEKDLRDLLTSRGRAVYACRNGKYVTAGNHEYTNLATSKVRYMIDAGAYTMLHTRRPTYLRDDEETPVVIEVDPNDWQTLARLPGKVRAFCMDEKKWVLLPTEGIEEIEWNKGAFDTLAIKNDAKELIEALIRNKLEADENTDVISNKGSGLIVLLHGGPGTGKTLTAESVAEIAEKPLYRVTCGDVGTDPVKVEEYLESVFKLSQRWDCVVLLDEADVFLEQRSLANLERNALVSVFLRVLEYYSGILILTSNRVGIFDEAFKSRIQLSLHYPKLDRKQRKQIWQNFISRLEQLGEHMDLADISAHLDDLATYTMNGRAIRNAITTARQLARFKQNARVNFEHLKHVIGVSQRFEDYIREVNEGVNDEDVARDTGIR